MRYRLMATYEGSPFEAGIGPTDADIVLFAACPPPEELGFEPATGHWRKQLHVADVQAVWESRPVGAFRGERCMVLDDLGDRLHIGYLGHDGVRAGQLGYWQVDRGVFELVVPRTEVTDILEERIDYARASVARTSGQFQIPAVAARPESRSSGQFPMPTPAASGQYSNPASYQPVESGQPSAYVPLPDSSTGVALPAAAQAPLPLEAEAMRAASAARRRPGSGLAGSEAAAAGPASHPLGGMATSVRPGAMASVAPPAGAPEPTGPVASRRATRRRMATERLFADLAALAGIPAESYSVGEAVDGALCLVQTGAGFEVFHSAGGARHELQVFTSEEAACFYLFGVLAAEAVRNGTLAHVPAPAGFGAGQRR